MSSFRPTLPFTDRILAELPRVRALLARLCGDAGEADDLVHEVWLRATRSAHGFDDTGSLQGWLGKTAFRAFLDWRAARAKRPQAFGDGAEAVARHDDPLARESLRELLAPLSETERAVLLRFHRDGESVREIAASLGLPEGTVKSHLHRARRKLVAREED